jgi:hypothetical protein
MVWQSGPSDRACDAWDFLASLEHLWHHIEKGEKYYSPLLQERITVTTNKF